MANYLIEYEPTSAVMNSGLGGVCPECEIQLKKHLARGFACPSRYRKSCLYLPIHLRLRLINVEEEISKMHAVKYDVVRYWNEPKAAADTQT
ncbi:unnamed protein product [Phytomonas sp. Hart1]|nr:unnamed protein product [Phytomonas sp. Hart1]|eukprot:CCW71772.1 unnamed protein product [Phytomonas sp. isolate Hart1]